jgi:hypothetical protein
LQVGKLVDEIVAVVSVINFVAVRVHLLRVS